MRNIGDVQYKWMKQMFEREIEKAERDRKFEMGYTGECETNADIHRRFAAELAIYKHDLKFFLELFEKIAKGEDSDVVRG